MKIRESDDPSERLSDFAPDRESFLEQVLEGLASPEKYIPCKFLYDKRGSELFDRICELEEYYLTGAELAILRQRAHEIAEILGPRCLLIEYGSGSSLKTRVLLGQRDDLAGYVPIDISRVALLESAEQLAKRYPHLEVLPVLADYTGEYGLPTTAIRPARRVVYFPGSTIGNFEPGEARAFLKGVAKICGSSGGLLIGVDLHKETEVLEAAYDDAAGVSAAFALNLLVRINRELDADFDLDRFGYHCFYDEAQRRVVMSLQSLGSQVVHLDRQEIALEEGERIRTEHSYKFTREDFRELAESAGFRLERVWTDDRDLFSLQYLRPA